MAPRDDSAGPSGRPALTPLWRELIGDHLRRLRRARGERLIDVAVRAGVSVQYLSEVERGRKEPSSEMVEALCAAFGITVLDLAAWIVQDSAGPRVPDAATASSVRVPVRSATAVGGAVLLAA